jgi:glycosyltransferase involved in cell wall biosynthesis
MNERGGQGAMDRFPRVSVITASLNTGEFLEQTIESVQEQTYGNVEHVIVDGASTDNTLEILKAYPHVRWVSEKEEGDNGVHDAFWKAFYMSTGEYIVYLCVSDGMVDRDWFRKSVEVLERDPQVSHVWGLPQYMMEDGQMGKLCFAEFLEHPPPQKTDFLAYWLATGHGFESNAVFRRNIYEECQPKNVVGERYRLHATLGFNYNLNTRGYLPYFLPVVSYYGRVHKGQRQDKHNAMLESLGKMYRKDVDSYRKNLLFGKVRHSFRDGRSEIIKTLDAEDLKSIRKNVLRYRLKHSLQRKFQRICDRI